MNRARRILTPISLLLLAASLVVVGCDSPQGVASRPESTNAPDNAPGMTYSIYPSSPAYDDAPEFDLQSVLRSSQGFNGIPPPRSASVFTLGNTGPAITAIAGGKLVPEATEARPLKIADASPTDELWIICQPETLDAPDADEVPGSGALMTMLSGQTEPVPVPLEHTEVTGDISGFIASVNVSQRFHNPFEEKIEAVYVFPLPQNSAVDGFIMTIGERQIRGIIRKRQEAEQIYAAAKAQGHVASLLTQERPNIFTQRVANIEPGKRIDVDITYLNTLSYSDGWYEFVFPMVVGPRFNPPWQEAQGTGIGVAPRNTPGSSGQTTEVSYLAPNERSGHDIGLELSIDAGLEIEDVVSTSHRYEKLEQSDSRVRIRLAKDDSIPNKDFVLRYRVAGDTVKPGMVVQRDADGQGGYVAMMLAPPADLSGLPQSPLEMVFVLDCSGSMNGRPLEQAKAAVARALDRLRPGDSFQIIRFSNSSSQLGRAPLDATPENLKRGRSYLASLNSGGGTMMIEGIKSALDFPHDPERLRFIAFLTDGYIGNEQEIIREIDHRLGDSRIFSFGVGSSPNRFLMNRMASVGRGAAAYVGLEHDAPMAMDLFLDRVQQAALTDITLDFGPLNVTEMYPRRVPDLFVGRPVVTVARFEGRADSRALSSITIRGQAGGEALQLPVRSDTDPRAADGLDTVWARMKIRALAEQATIANNNSDALECNQQIESIALAHGIMSSFTSFVAVDSSRVTEGSHGTTVNVPVPVPEGVKYETTVAPTGGS